ncbi:MAG TPA: Ig-like domain repeat protein [Gemmataceae bacterium]|nr:Ig-like domain repeat protein [Gemmataceae bacterium]
MEELETRLAPATHVWTGLGGNNNWTTAANWQNNFRPNPADGPDDLVFPAGASRLSSTNDFAPNTVFNSISFDGSGYTLSGNPITLGGPVAGTGFIIANQGASNNVIAFGIQMGGAAGNRQFFTVGTLGANLTISGALSGTTGVELSKDGPGTLILTANNSAFTGPISVAGGSLKITHALALGNTAAATTVLANAQLQIENIAGGSILEPLILNGPGVANDGALLNVAGNNTWAGPITLDSNSTIGTNANSTLTITGQIGDRGAGHGLTKEGGGRLILDPLGGAATVGNTYRGLTQVNAGTLTVRHSHSLGTGDAGTVVNSNTNRSGTLELEFVTGAGRTDPFRRADGFTVPDELLTLNGPGREGLDVFFFRVSGALNNLAGNNVWERDVTFWSSPSAVPDLPFPPFAFTHLVIGVEANTSLTINGVISENSGGKPYTFDKERPGRLILTRANTYTGRTQIVHGAINIRDSQALGAPVGPGGSDTIVFDGAALELEIDNRPDSIVTGSVNRLNVGEAVTITGRGLNNTGALRSISGLNEYSGIITLTSSVGAIGVDPDPTPLATDNYYTDDYHLRVTGVIRDDPTQVPSSPPAFLAKVGTGHLILTAVNTYTGTTTIERGWVSIENDQALGGRLLGRRETLIDGALRQEFIDIGDSAQSRTIVFDGAALHLRAPTPGGRLTVAENLTLQGRGITHPNPKISQKGALMNIGGDNIIGGLNTSLGQITFNGQVGVGVELVGSATVSELTLTGTMDDQPGALTISRDATGGEAEDRFLVDTGATSGTIIINYDFLTVPDTLRVYYPPGTRIFDSGLVSGANTVTIPYGPGPSTLVEIVINEGSGLTGTAWLYNLTIIPNLPSQGAFTKLGSKRLRVQGDGTFNGVVDVAEGVLRIQNDTALGSTSGGTIIRNGAALELDQTVSQLNGGIVAGIQVGQESLTLNGPGNTTNGPLIATLTSVSHDNVWRGPISLVTNVNIDVKTNSRLMLYGTLSDTANSAPAGSGLTKLGEGKLLLGGANTYRGATLINQGVVIVQHGQALGQPTAGTVVAAGASLELQGDITVAGESLTLQGAGTTTAPNIPLRWFAQGPAPVTNGQTPGNQAVSGRITGVAVDPSDPNVIYVSAAGGGAWRTKNGGQTWEPLIDNVPGASVQNMFTGAIAVAPTDPRIIYVALGEANNSHDAYYGRGILKTTDSGRTWTLIGNTEFERRTISKIVVDPENPHRIYVAVNGSGARAEDLAGNGGIWRANTQNPANIAWQNLTVGRSPADDTSITFSEFDDYTDLVVVRDPDFIRRPFNPAVPNSRARIIFFAVGTASRTGLGSLPFQNAVYSSLDDGGTWNRNGFVSTEVLRNNVTIPRQGMIKIAIGWNPPPAPNGITATNPGSFTVYAVTAYHDLYPFPTPNPTGTETALRNTFREVQRTTVTWDATNNVWVVGGWGNTTGQPSGDIMGSRAGSPSPPGSNNNPPLGQGHTDAVIAVDPLNPNLVFIGGLGQPTTPGPVMSTDGGATWSDIGVGAGGNGTRPGFHAMTFDSNRRLLVGTDGGIWRLDPATPATWNNLNGNLEIAQLNGLATHPSNPFVAVAGLEDNGVAIYNGNPAGWVRVEDDSSGKVYIDQRNPAIMYHVQDAFNAPALLRRSTQGGAPGTWTTVMTDELRGPFGGPPHFLLPDPYYFPLVLDPINTARLVAYGLFRTSYRSLSMWESNDRGATWFEIDPDLEILGTVRSIGLAGFQGNFTADPDFPAVIDKGANTYDPDTLYVAADDGVYVTKDHGLNWVRRNNGLPPTATFIDITVDPRNRDTAYVVAQGFGTAKVFKTTDAARSWTDITSNLPDVPAYKILVDPRNGDVFLGNDNGVYRLQGGSGTTWTRFGAGLPNVQVKELVLNPALNTLAAGTYGRGMFQLWLDDSIPNGGALRAVSGSSVWTGPVTLTGNVTIRAEAGAQVTLVGSVAENVAANDFKITKTGAGRLVLAAPNTYGGSTLTTDTEVVEGVLTVRDPAALGSPVSGTVVQAGAALETQSNVAGEPLTLNGDGIPFNNHNTGALRNVSNFNTYSGPITLATNTTIGVDSGSQLIITGVITDGAATRTLTKELTGTLVLRAANTYDGATFVNQGALSVQHAQALGAGGTAANGTQVLDGAQLQLAGGVTVVGEHLTLSGTGIVATGALLNVSGNNTWRGPVVLASLPGFAPPTIPPPFVSFNVAQAADILTIDGVISGSLGLTKIGPGRMILRQANTYTGVTTINAGVLQVDGSIGNVELNGGTLGGGGTVGTITSRTPGGVVNPGPTPTILRSGNVVWNGATTFFVDLGGSTPGTNQDQLQVTGTINLGGANLTGAIPAGAAINDTLVIITATGGVTGTFAQGNQVTISGRRFEILYSANNVVLAPERTATTTTLTQSVNPSVFGQPVSFVAVVRPVGGTPITSGINVVFTIDGQQTTVPVMNGQAVLTTSSLTVGSHSISASFAGTSALSGSSAGPITHTVNKANTQLTAQSSANPSAAGQPVTITVTVSAVSPGAGTPTGTILYRIDGALQNPVTLTNGRVDIVLTGLSQGTHTLAFAYMGDANFNTSSLSSFTQTVNPFAATTTLTSSDTDVFFGEALTLTATVTPQGTGAPTPTGTVTFRDTRTNQVLGTVNLDANGTAVLNPSLAAGTYTIVARYNGNSDYSPSTSNPVDQIVRQITTTTTLTTSNANARFGEAVIKATVTPAVTFGGTPTGTVTFRDTRTNQVLGTVDLDAMGMAVLSPPLAVGTYTIVATYNGTANFAGSTSNAIDQTVLRAISTTTLTSTNADAVFGEAVIKATVNPVGASGTVTFTDTRTNTVLGVVPVNPANGMAVLPPLAPGSYTIRADYSGDANVDASTSNTIDQTIRKADTTVVVTASATPSFTGQPVTFTATVAAVPPGAGVPGGTVTFFVDGTEAATNVPVVNGRASFVTASLTAGTHQIRAVYSGNGNFNGSTSADLAHPVEVNPLVFAAVPSTVRSGAPFGVRVELRNAAGQLITNFNGQVTLALASGPAGGVLGGTTTVNVVGGVASFTDLTLNRIGQYTFRASTLGGQVSIVSPFPTRVTASQLAITLTGRPRVRRPFGLRVAAVDITGGIDPEFNGPVTLTLVSGPRRARLTGVLTANMAGGVAEFTGLRVNRPGIYVVQLTAGDLVQLFQFVTRSRRV